MLTLTFLSLTLSLFFRLQTQRIGDKMLTTVCHTWSMFALTCRPVIWRHGEGSWRRSETIRSDLSRLLLLFYSARIYRGDLLHVVCFLDQNDRGSCHVPWTLHDMWFSVTWDHYFAAILFLYLRDTNLSNSFWSRYSQSLRPTCTKSEKERVDRSDRSDYILERPRPPIRDASTLCLKKGAPNAWQ